MQFTDFYKLLGVSENATEQEIKNAYRKLSKKFHPDMNDGDDFFTERFKEIQLAYETLIDNNRRAYYQQSYNSFKSQGTKNNQFNSQETKGYNDAESSKKEPHNTNQPNIKTKKQSGNIIPYIIVAFLVAITIGIIKEVGKSKIRKKPNIDLEQSISPNVTIPQTDTASVKKDDVTTAQTRFIATISPLLIEDRETTELRLIVENAWQVEQITPPSLKDFIVLSGPNQESGMKNNRQYLGITFLLRPKGKGTFTIKSATAKADGKTLRSNELTILVGVNAIETGKANK